MDHGPGVLGMKHDSRLKGRSDATRVDAVIR